MVKTFDNNYGLQRMYREFVFVLLEFGYYL